MIELKPNSRKILEYITIKYSEDPNNWVSNWQIEINTEISRSNISKYTKLLVSKNLIDRKYIQLGRAKEVYYKLTNSKEVLIFPEKSLNGVFKSAFRELLCFMKEVSKTPYLQYNEDQKNKFNPELQQLWVELLTRRNANIIDEAEERLEYE